MAFDSNQSPKDYQARLSSYLEKADDIKKSDLASYVFHRKVILDILGKAIERGDDGKYAREDLIHELIAPMRKTSDEVSFDSLNLWLIDERLAFHDFLASDKPISSFPITGCGEHKEPDICILNVFDEPLLVSESTRSAPANLTIVEIKRPMRNDAA
ncbi:ATP-binding protein, partial [Pseudomonas aeruginosa]|nr:ATP-binding protein [Pseudomonas aeruginosa]